MRKSKMIINKDDINYIININENDISSSFIMKTFAEFKGKSKFHPYDIITIPPKSYHNNKNSFTTTVGIYIFNKYFIEKDLFNIFGYINKTINKKVFGKINDKMSYALLEDKITLDQMKKYLMKTQKFMPFVSILSPSHTLKMLNCSKQIGKKKKELTKKYEKELKNGDAVTAEKMADELLDYSKEYLKDDPSMDSYDSGARGSFGNNFKNMFVMKGTIPKTDPEGGYNIALSNYIDGISKDEYHLFANSLAKGPYARAVKTKDGGYLEKQFVAAFQHVTLDPPGSDCKTKRYITVNLNESNIDSYMYCYIIEGNHLVELTTDVRNKYIGKTVKMRFSSLCESKTGICNKCAGNLAYRLGITNIGLAESILPSTLKNLSMKSFHDSTVVTSEMDPMKAFGLK